MQFPNCFGLFDRRQPTNGAMAGCGISQYPGCLYLSQRTERRHVHSHDRSMAYPRISGIQAGPPHGTGKTQGDAQAVKALLCPAVQTDDRPSDKRGKSLGFKIQPKTTLSHLREEGLRQSMALYARTRHQ